MCRLSRYTDYDGLHANWLGGFYFREWLQFGVDRKPHYNSEFTFHKYTRQSEDVYQVMLRRELWHGTLNGQVGFQLYPSLWGHTPIFEEFSFVEADGAPRLVLWKLREFIRRFRRSDQLILDGKKPKAELALLWYDASKRHQIESFNAERIVWNAMDGSTFLFHDLRVPYEAIMDEGLALRSLHRYKLVVPPCAKFLPREVTASLLRYIEEGGYLFLSGQAGTREAYSRRIFRLLPLRAWFPPAGRSAYSPSTGQATSFMRRLSV